MSSKTRFSLLLLEEGEHYLADFTAVYYPQAGAAGEYAGRAGGSCKGRLKLASRSLFFDADDWRLPVLRLPFSAIRQWGRLRDAARSMPSGEAPVFVVRAKEVVEMKCNGEDYPFVCRAGERDHAFSLVYEGVDDFLLRLGRVLSLSKMEAHEAAQETERQLQALEAGVKFDPSWIVSLDEVRLLELSCSRVTPLVREMGRLVITSGQLYFQPLLNISPEPVSRYALRNIGSVFRRRHALREVAIEIYFTTNHGDTLFLEFASPQERERAISALRSQPMIQRVMQQDSLTSKTYLWRHGKLSNFDYLLYLNHAADRTKNDLTQYPVFPWILSDYTSKYLDLHDAKSYRDLSKPIGALNAARLATFRQRFKEMPKDDPEHPPFLYGTHYSTPGYVLFYLVRKHPDLMLRLQNGKFDAPDRSFDSIAGAWSSCLNNPADVKELIPEFFEDAAFLQNLKRLELGVKQNGARVDDVELPPWAANAEDFVRQHRAALESEYVSQHLHQWIDLIFGYKQRGRAAIEADNLFYHLTYAGAVDIESVTDPVQRKALELQIREFGQTPKQLFDTAHPARLPPHRWSEALTDDAAAADVPSSLLQDGAPASSSILLSPRGPNSPAIAVSVEELSGDLEIKVFAEDAAASSASLAPTARHGERATALRSSINNGNTVVQEVDEGAEGAARAWDEGVVSKVQFAEVSRMHRERITDCAFSADGSRLVTVSKDCTLRFTDWRNKGRKLRSANVCGLALSACRFITNDTVLVSGWDSNVHIYSFDFARCMETLAAHDDAIGCMDVAGSEKRRMATGGWDTLVRYWSLREGSIEKHPLCEFAEMEVEVHAVALDEGGQTIAAGGEDGTLTFFDTRSNRVIREYRELHGAEPLNDIVWLPGGESVLSCGDDGKLQRTHLGGFQQCVGDHESGLSCLLSEGATALSGTRDGEVMVWNVAAEEQPHTSRLKVRGATEISCIAGYLPSRDGQGALFCGDDAGKGHLSGGL